MCILKKSNYLGKFSLFECWDNDVLYLIVTDKEPIAYLICTKIADVVLPNTIGTLMTKRTWCKEDYRRQGIVINLYRYLYNDANWALIADIEQTPSSMALWKQLVQLWPCYRISTKTLEIEHKRLDVNSLMAVYDNSTDHTIVLYGSTRMINTAFQVENFTNFNDYTFLLTED